MSPKPMPATAVMANVKIETRASVPQLIHESASSPRKRPMSQNNARSAASAPSPPKAASTRLSVINWRTNRARSAPMERRIAISRVRAAPRARMSPARFAQVSVRIRATINP